MVKKHGDGEVPAIEWLDRLSIRRAELVQEACYSRWLKLFQLAQHLKRGTESLYLSIELPRLDQPVVYAEKATDLFHAFRTMCCGVMCDV